MFPLCFSGLLWFCVAVRDVDLRRLCGFQLEGFDCRCLGISFSLRLISWTACCDFDQGSRYTDLYSTVSWKGVAFVMLCTMSSMCVR